MGFGFRKIIPRGVSIEEKSRMEVRRGEIWDPLDFMGDLVYPKVCVVSGISPHPPIIL